MGALSWQKIARILTLQFLEVSAGPTLVDFCHLSDCGPCCSAASRPKDPLRHSMLMSTVEVILEGWHDDVGRGGQRRQDLDRRQPRVDVVDNLSLTDKQPSATSYRNDFHFVTKPLM